MTTPTDRETKIAAAVALAIRDVAELPDRESPEEWPEAMLVTGPELEAILTNRLRDCPPAPDLVDIVFDGPPGPVAGRFVEVEDASRKSISFGQWVHRDDGYWALRIPAPDGKALRALRDWANDCQSMACFVSDARTFRRVIVDEIDRLTSAAPVADAEVEQESPLCCLQLPDGSVPTGNIDALECWHREANRMWRERDEARAENASLQARNAHLQSEMVRLSGQSGFCAECERLQADLLSKHGGEPLALLAELDTARAELADLGRVHQHLADEESENDRLRAQRDELLAAAESFLGAVAIDLASSRPGHWHAAQINVPDFDHLTATIRRVRESGK